MLQLRPELVGRVSETVTLRAMPAPVLVFVFNDPATSEIYTLSLHEALPILTLPQLTMIGIGPTFGLPSLVVVAEAELLTAPQVAGVEIGGAWCREGG